MEVGVYGFVALSAVLVTGVAVYLGRRRRADIAQEMECQLKKSAETIRGPLR
ncbi:hypothetical protein [Variovorax saccharolyticus]|uniref:hypothetical protein n=1 Tax=Variovorax saccharolyticus TaxID=3053516 RepID=UPI002576F6CA|nr:hypothetical protein [Variovorax sp. J31P216]MDM0025355.1 hypothetical protein [Variovorax sp. J31P216]